MCCCVSCVVGVQGLLRRAGGGEHSGQFRGGVRVAGRNHGLRISPDVREQDTQRVSVCVCVREREGERNVI
jgi:hypothetical protein